jgi:hypothetical protein
MRALLDLEKNEFMKYPVMILCITWNVSDNSMTKEDNDKRLEPW